MPSGRRLTLLPSLTHLCTANYTMQALVRRMVRIPPGAHMLVPLYLRMPLDLGATEGRRSWFVHPYRLKPLIAPREFISSPHRRGRVSSVSTKPRCVPAEFGPQRRDSIPPPGALRLASPKRPRMPCPQASSTENPSTRPTALREDPGLAEHLHIPPGTSRVSEPTSPGDPASRTFVCRAR